MRDMLEVTMVDGRELDIPKGAVVMYESMEKGENPNFPEAKVFLRYAMGDDLRAVLLSTKVEDLNFELGIASNPQWLRLTKKTGQSLIVLAANIVSRLSLEEGCEIGLMIGKAVVTFEVQQTRREIKKWSERGMGRPEGLVEIPVIPQEVE